MEVPHEAGGHPFSGGVERVSGGVELETERRWGLIFWLLVLATVFAVHAVVFAIVDPALGIVFGACLLSASPLLLLASLGRRWSRQWTSRRLLVALALVALALGTAFLLGAPLVSN